MLKVYVDLGHYNSDSGAVGNNLREVDINISYGKFLADELSRNGILVKVGKGGSLASRYEEANAWVCDIFVSVHANAGGGNGFEIFYYPGSVKGNALATSVYNQVVNIDKLNNGRGVKTANYAVLRGSKAPAILTEVAFIDTDDIKCVDEIHEQKDFGVSIATGILKYLDIKPITKPEESKPTTPSTNSWILRLQKALNNQSFRDKNGNRLVEDGIAGPLTVSACPLVKQGAAGELTKLIQEKVSSSPDGIFGTNTKTCVMKYQSSKGLSSDGVVGQNTWSKMIYS